MIGVISVILGKFKESNTETLYSNKIKLKKKDSTDNFKVAFTLSNILSNQ